jgi:hypothetical protein
VTFRAAARTAARRRPQRVFPECVDVLGDKFPAVEDAEEIVEEIAGPGIPGSWIGREPNNAGLQLIMA